MKPHPRIRKTVKCGGTLVSATILLLWLGSRWMGLAVGMRPFGYVAVYDGQIRWADDFPKSGLLMNTFPVPDSGFGKFPWSYGLIVHADFRQWYVLAWRTNSGAPPFGSCCGFRSFFLHSRALWRGLSTGAPIGVPGSAHARSATTIAPASRRGLCVRSAAHLCKLRR